MSLSEVEWLHKKVELRLLRSKDAGRLSMQRLPLSLARGVVKCGGNVVRDLSLTSIACKNRKKNGQTDRSLCAGIGYPRFFFATEPVLRKIHEMWRNTFNDRVKRA